MTQFKVPEDFIGVITDADGVICPIVNNVVNIADDKVPSNIWGFGVEQLTAKPKQPASLEEEQSNE